MRDGRYIVEYMTQDPLENDQQIRIGEFEIEHDWIMEVDGPQLEEELKLGPLTPQAEDLIERGYNNGYYRTRKLDAPDDEPNKRRMPPTWSAV